LLAVEEPAPDEGPKEETAKQPPKGKSKRKRK
jgi:hypothetical protein